MKPLKRRLISSGPIHYEPAGFTATSGAKPESISSLNRPTRIFSDLHYGHPGTLLRDVGQFAPLLEGVEHAIFNGDTVEMRFAKEREKGAADLAVFRAFCEKAGTKPVFLTGNHDPALSNLNHLDLLDGALLVTHGDVLFHGLTPWSRESAALKAAHHRELEALAHPADLETCLLAARRTALSVQHLGPRPHHRSKLRSSAEFLREIWPLWRPLSILTSWARTPSCAGAFAARYRPEAKMIVIGHTHFGGVWRVGQRLVVNTGTFMPYSRRFAVDLISDGVAVREIVEKAGTFHPGREIARLGLEDLPAGG